MELDTIWSGLTDWVPSTADLSNSIGFFINEGLHNTIGQFLYAIVSAVNWFIAMVYQLFEVFSGQIKVSYQGDYQYLTNEEYLEILVRKANGEDQGYGSPDL